jgi:CelD/BcsL family acetyltransferase involved in cellulose biosynthesis
MMTRPPPATASTRILQSREQFTLLLPEWRELFSSSPDAAPFQGCEWLMGWIDEFRPQSLVGVEIREANRLVGFAPLLVYRRNNERVLAFAGGGVSDYLGALLKQGHEGAVVTGLLNAVHTIPDWDVLDLTDLPSGSFLVHSHELRPYVKAHDLCFVLTLPSSSEELLHSLSKRQWASLRNARSRTQRQGGAVMQPARPGNALEFLEDLFRLHTNRWKKLGQSGVLGDPQVQQFHREVVPSLLSSGLLRLYRMRMNDCTIAVNYSFFHRQSVYCYLQGFDPEFSHLSPGMQLMFAVIEEAVRFGARRFDFLRGEEGYKLHWRPGAEPTFRVEIPRSLVPGRLRAPG